MKSLLVFLFFICYNFAISQDVVFEYKIPGAGTLDFKKNYIVENEKQNENILFYFQPAMVYAFRLDTSFNILQQYKTNIDKKSSYQLLGNSKKESNYTLFFSNKKLNSFYCKTISFKEREDFEKEILSIDNSEEKLLETLTIKDKFYILTLFKNEEKLKLYEYYGDVLLASKVYDLKRYKNAYHQKSSLYGLANKLDSERWFKSKLNILKVNVETDVALEVAVEQLKMFNDQNKIIITINSNAKSTEVIEIDLKTLVKSEKTFENPVLQEKEFFTQGNSFYNNGKLFVMSTTYSELKYMVYDYYSKELIAEDNFLADEEIQFKNTELIREGGFFEGNMTAKKRNLKFLRILSKSDIGLSVVKNKLNEYIITFGGIKEVNTTNVGGGFVSSSSSGGVTMTPIYHYNSVGYNFYSSTQTTAVYFKSKLNESFEHEKGKIINSEFNEVQSYVSKRSDFDYNLKLEEVYKISDYFVLLYYDWLTKTIYVRKFEE